MQLLEDKVDDEHNRSLPDRAVTGRGKRNDQPGQSRKKGNQPQDYTVDHIVRHCQWPAKEVCDAVVWMYFRWGHARAPKSIPQNFVIGRWRNVWKKGEQGKLTNNRDLDARKEMRTAKRAILENITNIHVMQNLTFQGVCVLNLMQPNTVNSEHRFLTSDWHHTLGDCLFQWQIYFAHLRGDVTWRENIRITWRVAGMCNGKRGLPTLDFHFSTWPRKFLLSIVL